MNSVTAWARVLEFVCIVGHDGLLNQGTARPRALQPAPLSPASSSTRPATGYTHPHQKVASHAHAKRVVERDGVHIRIIRSTHRASGEVRCRAGEVHDARFVHEGRLGTAPATSCCVISKRSSCSIGRNARRPASRLSTCPSTSRSSDSSSVCNAARSAIRIQSTSRRPS